MSLTAVKRARDRLARVRERADEQVTEASEALSAAVRAALADGASVSDIGAALGVGRQRVYQIRDGRR